MFNPFDLQRHFKQIAKEPIHKLISTNRTMKSPPNMFKAVRNNLWEKQMRNKMFPNYYVYFELSDWPQSFELPLHKKEIKEIKNKDKLNEPYLKMFLDQDSL